MAHFSGLIAAKRIKNPFEFCDIVTTTTHKTLRGPRAGMIFYKKEYEKQINNSVFPGLQGGPHEHQIAAIATQLKEVTTPEFKLYIQQVKKNSKALSEYLINLDYKICTNGTDNHLILVDLRNKNISGSKIEKICEFVNISINKNSVPGDKSALSPGGIRIGSPSLTTRGFKEDDFRKVGEFLHESILIALKIQDKVGKKLKVFVNEFEKNQELKILKNKIVNFSEKFPLY